MADPGRNAKAQQPPPPSFEAATSASSGNPFRTRFACVTLAMSDRVRFINFPQGDVMALREVVQSAWEKGVQDVRRYGHSDEFKLHGYPWRADYAGYDKSRHLVRRLLEALYDRGWVMQASVDVSKRERDKDSLLFRYQSPPPPPCDWLVVSFDRADRLKIVDPPPQDLAADLVRQLGSLVSKHETGPGFFEIKFHGYPWHPSGEDAVNTRLLLLNLLETMEAHGFSLYASIDQSNSSEGREADVMYFHRQKGWRPGMPIWHR